MGPLGVVPVNQLVVAARASAKSTELGLPDAFLLQTAEKPLVIPLASAVKCAATELSDSTDPSNASLPSIVRAAV